MADSATLGTVLVVGGGGFLGFYVTRALCDSGLWTSIIVASRDPSIRLQSVIYQKLDITSEVAVRALLDEVRPRLVIHLSSPPYNAAPHILHNCNVDGTEILLRCCKESSSVVSLLYTSSNRVIANKKPGILTEDMVELYHKSSKVDAYSKTKAIADAMVLEANEASLKTGVLRVPIVYGFRDTHMEIVMDLLRQGKQNIQLGDDNAIFEFLYVENAADAHVLAAKALLDVNSTFAGEACSITDDHPMTWFTFARLAWIEAGDVRHKGKITIVPFWFLTTVAFMYEWVCWLWPFGQRRALDFTQHNVKVLRVGNNVLDIGKAKRVLGYSPRISTEEGVRRAVREYQKDGLISLDSTKS